jgi:hypothetical protein
VVVVICANVVVVELEVDDDPPVVVVVEEVEVDVGAPGRVVLVIVASDFSSELEGNLRLFCGLLSGAHPVINRNKPKIDKVLK